MTPESPEIAAAQEVVYSFFCQAFFARLSQAGYEPARVREVQEHLVAISDSICRETNAHRDHGTTETAEHTANLRSSTDVRRGRDTSTVADASRRPEIVSAILTLRNGQAK